MANAEFILISEIFNGIHSRITSSVWGRGFVVSGITGEINIRYSKAGDFTEAWVSLNSCLARQGVGNLHFEGIAELLEFIQEFFPIAYLQAIQKSYPILFKEAF